MAEPTDIQLSSDSFNENESFAATLTTTDADSTTFTYSLLDDPSGFFLIVADQLKLASPLDFENLPAGFTDNGDGTASIDLLLESADESNNTYQETVTLTVNDVTDGTGTVVAAINAGGNSYTALDGTVFSADTGFTGGKTYSTSDPIANTEDDTLYQSERYASSLSYDIGVANGDYEVTLHFAEIFFNDASSRIFDVLLEGSEVVPNLDIAALVGHDAAHTVTLNVSVLDGNLDLDFFADANNAKLSAIVVREAAPSGEPPTDIQLSADTFDENASFAATLTTTDVDSTTFTYSILNDPSGSFQISGDQLELISPLDFENLPAGFTDNGDGTASVDVTLQTEDESNNTYDEIVTLTVNDVAETTEPPTDIQLSADTFDENASFTATLTTTDVDSTTFTYAILNDPSGSFQISGDQLELISPLDFENLPAGFTDNGDGTASVDVTLQTKDDGNNTYDEIVTLTVNDVAETTEPPTDIQLSADTFDENASFAATLTTTDVDSTTFTYAILNDPSGSFQISGDQLELISPLDFENLPAGFTDNGDGTASVDVTLQTEDESSNTYDEIATLTVNDVDEGGGAVVTAINSGGGGFTATDGTVFVADTNFTGGKTFSTSDPIAGTTDDTLYQSERYASNLSYDIGVANGDYEVTLHFAEIFFNDAGSRIFDVLLEGSEVVPNLDIAALVGHDAAHTVTLNVSVLDGNLDLDFFADANNAKLSALVVRTAAPSGEPPTDIQLSADTFDENASFTATLTTTDVDSTTFTYAILNDPSGSFQISGDQLELISPLDFENLPAGFTDNGDGTASVDVTLQTKDDGNNTYDEIVTLTVNDVAETTEPPTDIQLSADTFDENASFAATLTTTDVDSTTFTYAILNDPSGSFQISGDQLELISPLDFENLPAGFTDNGDGTASVDVTLQTKDESNNTYDEIVTLTVNDVAEATEPPTDIQLSADTFDENASFAATLTTTDVDSTTFTYAILNDPSASFQISGDQLELISPLDFENLPAGFTDNGDGTASVDVTLQTEDESSNTYDEIATLTVNDVDEGGGAVVTAINSGGGGFTATDGTVFVADTNFTGGKTFSTSDPIAGTTDDTLYQSERYASNLSYDIGVANGDYEVTLHFAEIFFNDAGSRIFDVLLEGSEVVPNLDIAALVGHDAAHTVTLNVSVLDGNLDLDFFADANNAKLSALVVRTAAPSGEPPTDIQLSADTFDENASFAATLTTTDVDSTTFTYAILNDPSGSFQISGDQLELISPLDFENLPAGFTDNGDGTASVDVTLQTKDDGNNTYDEIVTLTVNDVAETTEPPTDIQLSADTFDENASFAATLTTTDVDSTTFTYAILNDPSGSFQISGDQLELISPLDFENLPSGFTNNGDGTASVDVTLRTVDESNNTYDEIVTLTVNDVAEGTSSTQAYLAVTPSGGINASTFNSGSFKLTNNSLDAEQITEITIDLSTALLPGLVFDPAGLAGDKTAKDFTADSGETETGLTGHNFSVGSDENGWLQLTLFFSDFDPGETFEFSVDVDPDSIKGLSAPGPNESGSVSGLEMSGSLVSISYSDLTTATNQLFAVDGSNSGGETTVAGSSTAAPNISIAGLTGQQVAVSSADQTLEISGPAGATVRILLAEGGGFTAASTLGTLDTYEANSVVNVQHLDVVLGSNGTATLPITLTTSDPEGGLNHIAAAVVQADGTLGAVTAPLVVEYNKAVLPSSPTVAINSGGGSFTASDGTGYDADSFFSGGNTFSTTNSISGTTDDQLYQTERFGQMSYAIPLPSGDYYVTLQFAEIAFDNLDARVFDVLLENSLTINNLDIFSLAGADSALDITVPITLTDGTLNLDFQAIVDNPKISGIRIANADASGSGLAPTDLHVAETSFSEDFQFVTDLGANDNDSDTLTFMLSDDPSGQFVVANNQLFTTQPIDFEALPSGFTDNGDGTASVNLTLMAVDENNNAFSKTVTLTVTDDASDTAVAFQKISLNGEISNKPTSIQFGPDGRLYVSEVDGNINIYEIAVSETGGQFSYSVVNTETIELIANIVNHNDDGSVNTGVTGRQVTGIVVTGDAANPVIYVSSSDPRIGGGGSAGDKNLDTNSGIISRLTWNGTSWDKIDIVRGLPRSEENHATNGLQYDPLTNTLYVAQGGNTNAGAPSNNFAFLNEFALAGAILTVDLDVIEAMTVKTDANGQDYLYNLPTVNDPTVDDSIEDTLQPWGGNDGLNMTMLTPDSPVQIYSPGFRNIYDLVLTAEGKIYTIDNGANTGWGGLPFNEGTDGTVTNQYDSSEPGSTEPTADGEEVDDSDALHLVANAGYYGGHPNPLRANPEGAGLYTFGVFEDSNGNPIGVWSEQGGTGEFDLPSTWLPVDPSLANPIEGDFIAPSSAESTSLAILGKSSVNGIVEYTATAFNGALVNNLLTVSFGGDDLLRVILNSDGTQVLSVEELASNFADKPLDITATADDGPLPGTIWVASLDGGITVFTPTDAPLPSGDPNADDDGDGYTNQDELDNDTDPLNPASVPEDFDGDLVSDLNDDDDDNDTIIDLNDSFARDSGNGLDTLISPGDVFRLEFDAIESNGGFFNIGLTGLMTNGITDYLNQYDTDNILAGGATSAFAVQQTTTGDATNNDQDNGFQFGVSIDPTTTSFVFETVVTNPFQAVTPTGSQSAGIQIGTGDQDNYVKFVLSANDGAGGLLMLSESGGVETSTIYDGLLVPDLLTSAEVRLLIELDVTSGEATPAWEYVTSGGITESGVGDPMVLSGTILDAINGTYSIDGVDSGLALGIINTHLGAAEPIKANYDFLEIYEGTLGDALIV